MKKGSSFAALAAALVALSAAAYDFQVELKGEVGEEEAVAAPISPFLYRAASRKPDALAAELRVLDGALKAVPYAIRPSTVRVVSEREEWRRLAVVSATETNGELVVEAEWPEGESAPQRLKSLKVATPLADFEERVVVFADDVQLAEGTICDRRKFADVRSDVVPLNAQFRRRLKVVFSTPVAEVASRDYERTVSEGEKPGTATRRVFSERAFRIDALSVSFPSEAVSYESAPPMEWKVGVQPRFDAKEEKTVFEFDAAYMPIMAISLDVKSRNFSRWVRILKRANGGWREFKYGRIGSIDLPDQKVRNLSVLLDGEVREGILRVEVDDMDDPLEYGYEPIKLLIKPYDAIFIAKGGEKYSLAIERGAKRPRYDSQVLDYLMKTRTLKRLAYASPVDGLGDLAPAEISVAAKVNPVAIASAAAFIALLALSIFLFRSHG